jgi:tetratricopeptide (TPR) repeat protein
MKKSLPHLFALALLLCASTPHVSAKENWIKIRSKNFTLIGNTGEGEIRKVGARLEMFREAFAQIFPSTRLHASVPTTVLVFKTDSSYTPFKPKRDGKTQENVGGYFLPSADINYITFKTELHGVDPFHVIFHEYVHFLVDNNFSGVPLWLNEGLAEYYSTFQTSENNQKIRLGMPIDWHLRALQERGLLSLNTLLEVDTRSPHYSERSKVGIFYAESWAFVHYLMLANNMERKPQLVRFLSRLNSGISLETNFRQSFQTDYAKMEAELDAYIKRFRFPVLEIDVEKPLDYEKEMQSTRATEAEVQFHLGDLLLRMRRYDEAEVYLQKALALDAKFVNGLIALGTVRARQQRCAEANKLLQQAIELDASNYLGHYQYASCLLQEGQSEKAIESLRQAIKLKPELSYLHRQLGLVYSGLRRDVEAVETYTQALRLDLRDAQVYYSRSFINLRLGRGNQAAADALSYLNLNGWQRKESLYMALVAYAGSKRERRAADATRILDNALANCDASAWPYPILRYLKGSLTEQALLAGAKDNDELTEAHAYLGLDFSASDKRDEALAHLRWVRENGNKEFVEYPLALAELERLERASAAQDK